MACFIAFCRSPFAAILALVALSLAACNESDQRPFNEADDEITTEALPLGDPGAGDVLVLGGGVSGKKTFETIKVGAVEFFDAKKLKFAKSGALKANRVAEPAAVIGDGALEDQVLLSGGMEGKAKLKGRNLTFKTKAIGSSEAYDPDSEKSQTLGGRVAARVGQTATALPDGRVVIIGGFDSDGVPLAIVEIYDPLSKTVKPAERMVFTRALHTATLLGDGTILVAGGMVSSSGATTNTAEIYDPDDGTVFIPPRMTQAVAGHAATLISGCGCSADGKVLISGGFFGVAFGASATESTSDVMTLYNPVARNFGAAPKMTDERALQGATLLKTGKVLITGGLYGQVSYGAKRIFGIIGGIQDSAEIYDPEKNEISCLGGKNGGRCKGVMINARTAHGAVLLPNGKVLLLGGVGAKGRTTGGSGAPLKTAELYDPAKAKFLAVGSMGAARVLPATAVVP
ncbi:kelch repeat-containing protein [Methylopila sp. M107]|uniref:Kelch repeat-containing protein n=1 Tax=Methylopila sp. M107 TaxID=1101190 RepID=UPI0003601900|nr:kelch repeat-containing protein [Methylopila sp. M107]